MNRILTTEQWHESLAEAFHKAVKSACQDLIDEAVKAEREACAKLCDEMGNSDTNTHAWDAAAAIRARGADD